MTLRFSCRFGSSEAYELEPVFPSIPPDPSTERTFSAETFLSASDGPLAPSLFQMNKASRNGDDLSLCQHSTPDRACCPPSDFVRSRHERATRRSFPVPRRPRGHAWTFPAFSRTGKQLSTSSPHKVTIYLADPDSRPFR